MAKYLQILYSLYVYFAKCQNCQIAGHLHNPVLMACYTYILLKIFKIQTIVLIYKLSSGLFFTSAFQADRVKAESNAMNIKLLHTSILH